MRYLFTTFEGGGHVAPAMLVAARLRNRGHAVTFVSDEANRGAAAASDLPFAPWQRAPNRRYAARADDPLDDWRHRWPPAVVRAICERVICGPAAAYAHDTLELVRRVAPDVVVTNELLFGSMMAAERAGVPVVALTSNLWCFPTRTDVPPFGPGFLPDRRGGRDAVVRRLVTRFYDSGREALNAARRELGLPAVLHTIDQLAALEAVLLGTSAAFDFVDGAVPAPFGYVGPLLDAALRSETRDAAAAGASVSWMRHAGRPNVLVSFSTAWQDQQQMLARCVDALGGLPVEGVVTTGPAIEPGDLPRRANVRIVAHADHERLLPHCDLVVCQGGHGTLLRALMHGVPVVVIPSGRDHFDNAARVRARQAGRVLGSRPSVRRVARAIVEVLRRPELRASASRWGARIAADANGGHGAAEVLERIAATPRSRAQRFAE